MSPRLASGASPRVQALTPRPEQPEDLDGRGVGAAEPVRDTGVELGRFARCEHEVVFPEHLVADAN